MLSGNEVYRSDGLGGFSLVAGTAITSAGPDAVGRARWVDVDGDGRLDVWAGKYLFLNKGGGALAKKSDFSSRAFGPCVGIDEDPVCGSAHCALGPYWQEKLGKAELQARAASPRGGHVRVRLAGERVLLGGRAVTTMTGRLRHASPPE